jgi:Crp-like helix-turn-helix domain
LWGFASGEEGDDGALHREHAFSDMFVAYLLARNIRYEEDLVDQLFNSSEKRLARVLLLLARFGKEGAPEAVVPKISQETLAEMVGTTRSRVSFFMNRFRKLGFIHYNGGLQVHSSLLNVVLHDWPSQSTRSADVPHRWRFLCPIELVESRAFRPAQLLCFACGCTIGKSPLLL